MHFSIRWKPAKNDQRERCGTNLYVKGYLNGTKKFQSQVDHGGTYAGQYATWVSVTGIIDLSVGDLVTFWVASDQTDGTAGALVGAWNSTNPGTWAMGYKIG